MALFNGGPQDRTVLRAATKRPRTIKASKK
jgi:hypothetical protein